MSEPSDNKYVVNNLRARVAELELMLETVRAELRAAQRELWQREAQS